MDSTVVSDLLAGRWRSGGRLLAERDSGFGGEPGADGVGTESLKRAVGALMKAGDGLGVEAHDEGFAQGGEVPNGEGSAQVPREEAPAIGRPKHRQQMADPGFDLRNQATIETR